MSQIRIERCINGFIVSTGAYKKSVYPTLNEALDVIKRLITDDIRREKERKEKIREFRNSNRRDD